MDPNEPFDYERLDALLRDIGYEEPDEDATPAQGRPQSAQQPVQHTQQPRPHRPTAAQEAARQQLFDQYYGRTQNAQPSGQAAPRGQQPQQTYRQPQQAYRQQPQQVYQQRAQQQRRAAPPRQTPPPAPPAGTQHRSSAEPPEPPQKRKKKHRLLKFFLFLLFLLALLAAVVIFLLRSDVAQPQATTGLGARKDGCSTILLAGTDAGGTRTDTIMLCTIDAGEGRVSLLSIPRDTLVNDSYAVPKINGTYGVYGGGEDGMDALMNAVEKLIGFRPDGYVLIDLDGFVEVVDLMGGVEFDVPQDMYYVDPAQNLNINLSAGLQTLNGEQAMGLVRYRSGYAMADLQRVNVQRDFISACLDQWVTLGNALKAPRLIPLVTENITTDLSIPNLIWCAGAVMRCDTAQIETNTLPGYAANWNGGSYYIASAYDIIELVNELYNPYLVDVTIYDLDVRTP